ncbi:MAG: hypothetical protein HON47_03655, partial [Candidatus Diapherotrites archaeon]|nr:hypothetical protein [Candidatus Diapherotrites archaeon]
MNKRWRNLVILLVIVIIVLFVVVNQNLFDINQEIEPKTQEYISLIEKNDLNYSEFKLALELFGRSIDSEQLNSIYLSAPDDYLKQLVEFERRQDAVAKRVETFYSRPFAEVCEEIDSGLEIYGESFSILVEMEEFLNKRNDLLINLVILDMEESDMQETYYEYLMTCAEIEAMAVL